MNKEIFALMAHAEDLQKIADKSQESLRQSIVSGKQELSAETRRLKTTIDTLPKSAQSAIKEAFTTEATESIQKAEIAMKGAVEAMNGAVRSVWIMPTIVSLAICVVLALFAYFVLSWLNSEKLELQREMSVLEAKVNEFERRAGKANLKVCGEGKRLCIEVDTKTWYGSEEEKYYIIKGY